jgi:hypothetical protein
VALRSCQVGRLLAEMQAMRDANTQAARQQRQVCAALRMNLRASVAV